MKSCPQEAARARHRQFVVAIGEMITRTEQSLKEMALKDGRQELSWVRLDEGERNELALFLEGSPSKEEDEGSSGNSVGDSSTKGLIPRLVEVDVLSAGKEKVNHNGHRRTASAADADSWKITMGCDGEPHLPPPRIPSFSGFVGVAESATKLKWPKNGFRKWKVGGDRHQAADSESLRANHLSRVCSLKICFSSGRIISFSCLPSVFIVFAALRELKIVMKEVRAAWMVVTMSHMISSFMGGLVLCKDSFKDLSIIFNIVDPCKSSFGLFLSFFWLVSLVFIDESSNVTNLL